MRRTPSIFCSVPASSFVVLSIAYPLLLRVLVVPILSLYTFFLTLSLRCNCLTCSFVVFAWMVAWHEGKPCDAVAVVLFAPRSLCDSFVRFVCSAGSTGLATLFALWLIQAVCGCVGVSCRLSSLRTSGSGEVELLLGIGQCSL